MPPAIQNPQYPEKLDNEGPTVFGPVLVLQRQIPPAFCAKWSSI